MKKEINSLLEEVGQTNPNGNHQFRLEGLKVAALERIAAALEAQNSANAKESKNQTSMPT